ncbi:MAG: type I restriction-modification enzyme R subunit C-terminal domain-containing protein, partial [Pirellula sp.]
RNTKLSVVEAKAWDEPLTEGVGQAKNYANGTPMSSLQFMEMFFGKLPEFFKDEAELRSLWCEPATRKKLLEGLTEKGFGREQLTEMQRMIDAEKSDLFDVLAHVAYALSPLSREERAAMARIQIMTHFNDKQQAFLDFVLAHFVTVGVEELDQEKLTPLLRLKYDSISDAIADLGGKADEIGRVFAGFQKYLYEQKIAAYAIRISVKHRFWLCSQASVFVGEAEVFWRFPSGTQPHGERSIGQIPVAVRIDTD